ncbi:MAG: twin-arginine translocase subunit TatB [Pseudomonadota bacterium]
MFGLSWGEMMVVGIVALIIIGPKDLPVVFRTMGEFTGKARAMAREFSRAMNDAAKDSGVNDISKGLKAATNPTKFGVDKIKEATGVTAAAAALSPERAETKEKADRAMAKAAEERLAREAEKSAKAAEEARKPVKSEPKPDSDA